MLVPPKELTDKGWKVTTIGDDRLYTPGVKLSETGDKPQHPLQDL